MLSRFLAKTCPEPNTGCWLWTAYCNRNGYGKIRCEGKSWYAHRIAFLLFKGPIPLGFEICHACDVPACVNPEHLFLGTHEDNMKDCITKNRFARGDKHPRAKLTAEQVLAIRTSLRFGERNKSLAEQYGVHKSTIAHIKRQDWWKNVQLAQEVKG